MSRVRLPRHLPGQPMAEYLDVLVVAIERAVNTAAAGTYAAKGAALRTLDAGTAAPGQTAQVLATLIGDLRAKGVLG